jgi:alkylation response protein AidB-like acyl-CoA dehydrogenase
VRVSSSEGAPCASHRCRTQSVAHVEGADATAPDGPRAAREGPGAPLADPEAGVRMSAWCAASTGYLAGLGEEALRLALGALEPVQQMLADAATLVDGLTLLSADSPGANALAHAGDAAERAVAIWMQVTGALGFTLEFPLQRAYRRSRSARVWADAVLLAWESPAA